MTKKNNWNLQEMQETLVKDTEQRISDGFHEIASASVQPKPTESIGGEKAQPSDIIPQTSEQEPTKGVQTYIAVSMYRRLSDIKLTRGETIGNLVAEAVALWLDVQEGKQKVSEVI